MPIFVIGWMDKDLFILYGDFYFSTKESAERFLQEHEVLRFFIIKELALSLSP